MGDCVNVIIYQMGKCASTTVYESLKGISGLKVYHIHSLNRANIESHVLARAAINRKPYEHVQQSSEILDNKLLESENVKVISLVREPVARNISAFFQNLDDISGMKNAHVQKTVEVLIQQFLSDYSHNIPLNWFDNEFKRYLEIDVYSKPFDLQSGYELYAGKAPALVMHHNLPNDQKRACVEAFLEMSLPEFLDHNLGEKKDYSDKYRKFTEQIELPKEYLDSMYDSLFVKHFYSSTSIDQFRAKWSGS